MISFAYPQQKIAVEEYIDTYKSTAIEEMIKYRIPASITLAQGILESNSGNSPLAVEANNHFGIKCHKEWTGKTFHQDDDEKDECFRKYNKAEESYRDHSEFLTTRERYKTLFDLEMTDYKGWAYGLKQAGYATNPKYPELLIKIIEENRLDVFDKMTGQQLAVSGQQSAVGGQQSAVGSRQSAVNSRKMKFNVRNPELRSGPPEQFEISGRGGNDRMVFINNGVKFIYAEEGDDLFLIASEFGIYTWQVCKYNDLSKDDKLIPGQKVYLENKRRKADYDYHIVKTGEDLNAISQAYGIRVKALCRINLIQPDIKLAEGDILLLK
jgi:LysM repeat protein